MTAKRGNARRLLTLGALTPGAVPLFTKTLVPTRRWSPRSAVSHVPPFCALKKSPPYLPVPPCNVNTPGRGRQGRAPFPRRWRRRAGRTPEWCAATRPAGARRPADRARAHAQEANKAQEAGQHTQEATKACDPERAPTAAPTTKQALCVWVCGCVAKGKARAEFF